MQQFLTLQEGARGPTRSWCLRKYYANNYIDVHVHISHDDRKRIPVDSSPVHTMLWSWQRILGHHILIVRLIKLTNTSHYLLNSHSYNAFPGGIIPNMIASQSLQTILIQKAEQKALVEVADLLFVGYIIKLPSEADGAAPFICGHAPSRPFKTLLMQIDHLLQALR